MANHNKTLHLIASKLGLVNDDKIVSKAAEFERLLQTRSVAGSNMTDTSKVVICLHLAAEMLRADLDQKTAIKYSGLKPAMYTNSKKMIQNLLELNSGKLTTTVLCAALQCSSVQSLADQILNEYQRQAKMEIDLNLPQYVCMAVYHACRISKVKVSKAKINEKARLKPAQWAKLDADWTKFVDEHFVSAKKKPGRALKKNQENEPEQIDINPPEKEDNAPEIEPYEDWKRRMLEKAYRELSELEKIEAKEMQVDVAMTPKSRNTPQKTSPFESPVKEVRVLLTASDRIEAKEMQVDVANTPKPRNTPQKTSPFKSPVKEVRVLLTASDRIEAKDLQDVALVPRRSPRKTPQKYSPYKSPGKIKGVRLLFPTS